MYDYTTGNETVDAMAKLRLTGNITPQIWYQTITKENGKPHLLAIAILSDIVYWYRPLEVRDEMSGNIIGYRKKFKADMLQRSYDQFAELFGESKRSITDAVIRLEVLGLIKRIFRTIDISGIKHNNVLFIQLFPKKVYDFTYPNENVNDENTLSRKNVTGPTKKCDSSPEKEGEVPQNLVRRNTKNTTKNTTENISSSSDSDDDDQIIKAYYDITNGICAQETVTAVITEIQVQGKRYMKSISPTIFLEICKNITEHSEHIANKSAYIRKCIENMIAGQKLSEINKAHRIRAQNQFLKQNYNSDDWNELEQRILSN